MKSKVAKPSRIHNIDGCIGTSVQLARMTGVTRNTMDRRLRLFYAGKVIDVMAGVGEMLGNEEWHALSDTPRDDKLAEIK